MSEQQVSEQQASFSIEKLYVKDLSLEVPNAPQVFLETEAPSIDIQLENSGTVMGNDMYEAVLKVTITAKRDDKTYFLVEVSQAGIFRIVGVPQEALDPIMAVACPNILFPYARESVSDAVNRAGFPPVILAPVNFEAMYQQRMAAEPQAAAESTTLQ